MLRLLISSIRFSALATKVSLPLGLMLLLGSNAAALPVPRSLLSVFKTSTDYQEIGDPTIAQADNSTPPDVVVDTQTPGSEPTTSTPTTSTPTSSDPRFACETINGEYTVMYRPQNRPGQAYPWAIPRQMGGGWSAQSRCAEISRRLESYRPDGLVELTTGVENNYDVVCVTTQADPNCRIVFTVPPGQDPIVTRDRVFQNLLTADSGQQTTGVTTYTRTGDGQLFNQIGQLLGGGSSSSQSSGINLRPFLSRADGGTGDRLRKAKSSPSNPTSTSNPGQLNPDLFR